MMLRFTAAERSRTACGKRGRSARRGSMGSMADEGAHMGTLSVADEDTGQSGEWELPHLLVPGRRRVPAAAALARGRGLGSAPAAAGRGLGNAPAATVARGASAGKGSAGEGSEGEADAGEGSEEEAAAGESSDEEVPNLTSLWRVPRVPRAAAVAQRGGSGGAPAGTEGSADEGSVGGGSSPPPSVRSAGGCAAEAREGSVGSPGQDSGEGSAGGEGGGQGPSPRALSGQHALRGAGRHAPAPARPNRALTGRVARPLVTDLHLLRARVQCKHYSALVWPEEGTICCKGGKAILGPETTRTMPGTTTC
jgi:hypothetical protein